MNKFDEIYDIRFAMYSDIEAIMRFIRTEWKDSHILGNDRAFFEYEFLDQDRVNFLLAVRRKTQEIEGIQGFLKMTAQTEGQGIWSCMWMVREKSNIPLLGLELSKRVESMTGCKYRIGPGSNPVTAIPIYKAIMKKYTDKEKQFYMLNPDSDFKIAQIEHMETPRFDAVQDAQLVTYPDIEELESEFSFSRFKDAIPYKDRWYYNKRFFHHPIYEYEVCGVKNREDKVNAVLVFRVSEAENHKALRIVDFFGEQKELEHAGAAVYRKLCEEGCEYVDFYCYGIEEEYLRKAGFTERTDGDSNILPNYFEPFVKQNVDIWFHAPYSHIVVCKADGDQDRPSTPRTLI